MTEEPRVIDLSVEVPGTVEEVWHAISTGEGIGSWFVPHEVEERAGGAVAMDFGEPFGVSKGTVTAWEPPHRVVFGSDGDRALAYEWTVEARDGGTCVVRLVNSGFGWGADWDGEYDAMSLGWRLFLENLRLHLTHFAGRTGHAELPMGQVDGPNDVAWAALCAAVGVAPDLVAGQPFSTGAEGIPAERGRVESVIVSPGELTAYVVVLDEPAPGTGILAAEGGGESVMVSFNRYSYDAPAGHAWTPFFADRFPMSWS